MAVSQLPEFERALAHASGSLDGGDLAECHGVACGLLCRQPGLGAGEFLRALAMLGLAPRPGAELERTLGQLFRATALQLDDQQMRLALWLPDDEDPLEERTQALGRWCAGFLAALGSGAEAVETLSGEAGEALQDLGRIARVEVGGDGDAEEEETAYAEIVEYIRVATLLVREDLRIAADSDCIH
jgi:uncharacterized protein YgfB (UPF0149 family)